MSKREGWWFRASTEQRLAQIDAAIALGLTAGVVAKNCGVESAGGADGRNTVHGFANRHGRHFPNTAGKRRDCGRYWDGEKRTTKRAIEVEKAKRAYLGGEPVDFWGAE